MSKAIYDVVNGVSRKVSKLYAVVDGVTRNINKSYAVKDGMTRLVFGGASVAFGGYTGTYTESDIEIDGVAHKLYTLTKSGTLTLTGGGNARYWICGGGEAGDNAGTSSAGAAYSGMGGDGGHFNEGTISPGEYVITVGARGGNSTIVSNDETITASSGGTNVSGVYGASTGGAYASFTSGGTFASSAIHSPGFISAIPFGVTSLKQHCAGGGGGCVQQITADGVSKYGKGGTGGSNGGKGGSASSSTSAPSAATGGTYGGGKGATMTAAASTASFYGGGGGGASIGYDLSTSSKISGKSKGNGYQGVCYIAIPA